MLLTYYFSHIIIFTCYGTFTIWILSDTFIILKDLNSINDKYNNLKIQNEILKDYNLFMKNKHDEIININDVLYKLIIIHRVLHEIFIIQDILNNIKNNIEEIKSNNN